MMQEENCQSGIQGILKQGPVKLKTGFGVWKKRWLVFQRATSYGPTRLVVCSKRLSFLKHPFGKKTHTVVFLRDINNVSKGATKHGETKVTIGFNIAKPYMEFICLEAQEDYWVECIRLAKGKEDNIENDTFRVYLLPAISLNYSGECILQIRNTCLTLFSDEIKRQIIVKWPLEVIRRFSKDQENKIFFLETGRMSTTGECLFNIRSYWFEEMFKKIVLAQAAKLEAGPLMNDAAANIDYIKSPKTKAYDPKEDSDEGDYLHPITGIEVRLQAGRNRCKMTDGDDRNQSLSKDHILSADNKCYLSVEDSTCNLKLETKEESPYLSMDSGHAKETNVSDEGDDQTGSQQLSYGGKNISGSLGSLCYNDPEVACRGNPPLALPNPHRQSHQLKNRDESVTVHPDDQNDGLIQGNITDNIGEDEVIYLAHDPLPIPELSQERSSKVPEDIPELSQKRSSKVPDDIPELSQQRSSKVPEDIPELSQKPSSKVPDDKPEPLTQPIKGDENASDQSDDGDYLTPIADLVKMSLKPTS